MLINIASINSSLLNWSINSLLDVLLVASLCQVHPPKVSFVMNTERKTFNEQDQHFQTLPSSGAAIDIGASQANNTS